MTCDENRTALGVDIAPDETQRQHYSHFHEHNLGVAFSEFIKHMILWRMENEINIIWKPFIKAIL